MFPKTEGQVAASKLPFILTFRSEEREILRQLIVKERKELRAIMDDMDDRELVDADVRYEHLGCLLRKITS